MSASRTSSSSFPSRRTVCDCGEELVLMTSNTVNNPGKKLWRCPNWKKTFTCDFFQWADEELLDEGTSMEDVEGYKLEIVKLKKKVSKLQRQLCELRSNRKWIIVTLVFSWAAMILIWILFAVKFLGSRQGILLGYP